MNNNRYSQETPAMKEAAFRHLRSSVLADEQRANQYTLRTIADLSPAERRGYSLRRAINCAISTMSSDRNSLETEISEAIAKEMGPTYGMGISRETQRSIFIPLSLEPVRERTGLVTTSTAAGGATVETSVPDLIQILRARAMIFSLGAQLLPGLRDSIAFPSQAATSAGTWIGEAPGSDAADSDMSLAQIPASLHTFLTTTALTRKLLNQTGSYAETMIRTDLMRGAAIELDRVALVGDGLSNRPTGIVNTAGVGTVAIGANGGAASNDTFTDLEFQISTNNADQGPLAYLTTPIQRQKLRKVVRTGMNMPVWGNDNTVNGWRAEVTNNLPSNGTKGSGTGLSTIIAGDWSQLLIAQWGVIEVLVDQWRLKKQGKVECTSFMNCDVVVRHAPAFAICTDAA